ncbi:MAG: 50S ribosomal protein L28 [Candidatus Omnitrophica bacterium]|nr:50S ribosomal protein L28 [Candidatus Omnitrophota bacterium]
MARACAVCTKTNTPGVKYKRRGMVRRKGGAGSKIVGKTLRTFLPNLQSVKVNMAGTIKRVLVCTKCMKAGKIARAA